MIVGAQNLNEQKIADDLQISLEYLFDVINQGSLPKLKKILTVHPALLNAQDPFGYTPLHKAVFTRNIEMVAALVMLGADLDRMDCDGFPPIAYTRRSKEIKDYLLKCNATDFDPQHSPLHIAVADRDIDSLISLARKQPQLLNAKNRAGATPLYLAAEKGDALMVEMLVLFGADLNATDNKGYPVVAIPGLEPKIQALLLGKGAKDPYITDLHLAALKGDARKLARLLKDEANREMLTAQDLKGVTPLHNAVTSGSENAVALLLEQGAKVNVATFDEGYLPIHFTEVGSVIYQMLLEAGSTDPWATPLHIAAGYGDLEQMRLHLSQEPDSVNILDSQGHSPLRYATDCGKKAAAKLLLAHGANPDLNSLDWQYPHSNPQNLVSNYIRTRTRISSQALESIGASFTSLIQREMQHAHQLGKKILVILGELHNNPKIMQVQKRLLGAAKAMGINHLLLEVQQGTHDMLIAVPAQKLGLSVTGVDNHPKRNHLDIVNRAIHLNARDKAMAQGIYDKNEDAVLIIHMEHMPGIVANLRQKAQSQRFHIVPINLTSMVTKIPAENEYTGILSHYRYDPRQVIQIEEGGLSDASLPIAYWNSHVVPNPFKLPPEREADETEPKSKRPRKK